MRQRGPASLSAAGPAAWNLAASQPFTACTIHQKQARLHFDLHLAGGQSTSLDLALIEAGAMSAEAALAQLPQARQNAEDYAVWLNSQIEIDDPLLRSLYVAGLNASYSMYKEFPGGFQGLVAGPDYAFPPRIYFRDSYWTAQALIGTAPELVRTHLLSLAAGVHPDGQCPSGIFAGHLLKAWHAPANCNADWLADHFDSPSFFILLLNDYLQATGDWELLKVVPEQINPRLGWPDLSVGQRAHNAINSLISRDSNRDGLIEKPYAANDWADNIRRSTWVAYDQALFIAALHAYAGWCEHIPDGGQPAHYQRQAQLAMTGMQRELWDDELGYFVNYRRPEFTEKNLSVDALVALYFHLLEEPQSQRILQAADRLLRADHNTRQPWGDYGLLCAFPLYSNAADLFDKSALSYCYHNGADWPYWDGVVANLLLERRDSAGLHVLTRWWSYGLEQGWLTPVEYYSPAYPVGGMLQGWSSMPAATLFRQLSIAKELLNEKTTK
jgi:glycogen debranching enzyme